MIISIETSLQNPQETIDIVNLNNILSRDPDYLIENYAPNNFISFRKNSVNIFMRLHKDGRIFVEHSITSIKNDETKEVISELFNQFNEFLKDNPLQIDPNCLRQEFTINIIGIAAISFFWEKYVDIKKVGLALFNNPEIRTYANNNSHSISIKLEPNCSSFFY